MMTSWFKLACITGIRELLGSGTMLQPAIQSSLFQTHGIEIACCHICSRMGSPEQIGLNKPLLSSIERQAMGYPLFHVVREVIVKIIVGDTNDREETTKFAVALASMLGS